jgi:F-type H+-transporting ATPase subunit gamma
MTRQAAEAAGHVPNLPILEEHDDVRTVAILLVTADRGLAGAFNSQVLRAGVQLAREHEGKQVQWYASGRRGVSSLTFRGYEVAEGYTGFTERPAYGDAREIASDLMAVYVDGKVDRVDIVYNKYISPLTQEVTRETLLPLQQATLFEEAAEDEQADREREEQRGGGERHALVEYEPDPGEILERLIPTYVEISIYRALLESSASELGARMTAMRNASENAGDIIKDLTLQMNRERQAEITQEIMEVVAGAEGLS